MDNVPQYEIFEYAIPAGDWLPDNPYRDVTLIAHFQHRNRRVEVEGFYDGEGNYVFRFMPDEQGIWQFVTRCNFTWLDSISGEFTCVNPQPGNHGPVRVADQYHFSYMDGTRYVPVGTTCYAWIHQNDHLEEQTLETLKGEYFNKLRMCIFPKHYAYNRNEPIHYPFETVTTETGFAWDYIRPNPLFWRHLEMRIAQLADMGIEADLILFHPYDRWGFADMGSENDEFYLRYAVARLAAFRNVWWSLANEYDLRENKSLTEWDRIFHILQDYDPYQHLRSIHNCRNFYNHSLPWVTHASIQHGDVARVMEWREQYRKPVVIDECGYEGDIEQGWGNFSPDEHLRRFWTGYTRGGYVGHGETYYNPEEILWWSKGGTLHGQTPERIRFLREILEAAPGPLTPVDFWGYFIAHYGQEYYLLYYDSHQPRLATFDLPEVGEYQADIIDTWAMTITPVQERFRKELCLEMPVKPFMAIRIEKVG